MYAQRMIKDLQKLTVFDQWYLILFAQFELKKLNYTPNIFLIHKEVV